MKITATGTTGFVGTNLSHYITQNGGVVDGLNMRDPAWREQIQDSNAIIHLAGKAHDLKRTSDEQSYFDVNTELTKLLFDAFLESNARDFIFMSSVKAAADTVAGSILTEEQAAQPATAYGRSKLAAEKYLLGKALPREKRVFILRPCMIHGPGNKGNLNLLYSVVAKGIPYPLGAFQNHRSFLSIDNLMYVINALLCRPEIPGGIYQLADDDPLSTNDVIKIISAELNKKEKIWAPPKLFVKALATMGDYLGLPLNNERLTKMTENYIVSNQKIKTALGIQRMPVSVSEGLAKTIRSFHKQ